MSLRPPSGTPPPAVADLPELRVELAPLAERICARYYEEFSDEHERYGEAGVDWCRHDNQWLLWWAAADVMELTDLGEQVAWLARVLAARRFPLERLARDLELAADAVRGGVFGAHSEAAAGRLEQAAADVRALVCADAG